jgi:hypothetical protein
MTAAAPVLADARAVWAEVARIANVTIKNPTLRAAAFWAASPAALVAAVVVAKSLTPAESEASSVA